MFWLIVLFCLLFILLIMLYLRVMEDKRMKISREEMPGKVSRLFTAKTIISCKIILILIFERCVGRSV